MGVYLAYNMALINLKPQNFSSIIENIKPVNIEVSPNPVNELSKLTLHTYENHYVIIELFNINGCLVKNIYSGNIKKGKHTFLINTKFFNTGIYILKVYAGEKIITKKIVFN